MTAVAVEQYRPAMDSCMVGTRLYRTCALQWRNNRVDRVDNVQGPPSSRPKKYVFGNTVQI